MRMVKRMLFLFLWLVPGVVLIKVFLKDMDKYYTQAVRGERQLEVMRKWMSLENDQVKIQDYLCSSSIKRIAIYGMGFLGQHLYENLKPSKEIQVAYGLDRNAANIISDLKIYSLEDTPVLEEEIDAIVISVCYRCGDIMRELKRKNNHIKILSLEKILDDIRCK